MEHLQHFGWDVGSKPDPRRELFAQFDQDGSGTIDIMELRQVMRHPKVRAAFKLSGDGKDQLSEAEIDAFANEMDKDGDGEISYDEFIAAMNKKEKDANKDFFKLRRSQIGLAGSDVIGTAVKHTETGLKVSSQHPSPGGRPF